MKDFSTNWYNFASSGNRTSDLSGAHDPVTLARFDVAGLQTVSGIIAPGEGVDPVASGASLSGKTLRVMPMGDSITKGTIPGGYRIYLHNLLSNSGATFDLVGKDSRTGDTTPDKDFWGNDGWQISDTTEVINSISYKSLTGENRSGLYDEMDAAISTTYFSTSSSVDNVILLQIGTNDFLKQVVRSTDSNANRSGEAATERLQALLNRINSLASSRGLKIKVILSQIPEITTAWTGDSVTSTTIAEAAEYRASMSAIANQSYSQLTVSLVDNFSSTLGELADGVHPNAEGYEDMGITFYNGLVASVATSAPPGGGTTAVTIDSVSSGAAYAVVNAINGQTIYIDRDYTLSGLPSSLSGEKLIRTRNDDDVVTANPHLRFTLGQASEVYIAYSSTANSLPSWMTGWSDTGTTVSAGVGGSFKLYKKSYAAGQVSLGGNNRGATNAVSNYFVIIKANETTPPVTPPTTPSSLGNTGNFTFGTDFTAYDPNQDGTGGHPANATVSGNGSSATITGNVWKKFPLSYTVTSQTMLTVTVNAPNAGEIIGVSLDNDNLATTGRRAFLFGGSQYGTSSFNDWSWSINPVYTSGSGAVTYLIPVGSYFTGSVNHLGLIGDSDASGSANVTYSAVRIYEQGAPAAGLRLQAESYTSASGDISAEPSEPQYISLENKWARYDNVDLTGATQLTASVATGVQGSLEFRLGSPTGTKIAEVATMGTSSEWRTFKNYSSAITGNHGVVTLYIIGTGQHGGVVDYVDFNSTTPSAPAAAPTFSVTPGAYTTAQSVALSSVTPGATIRFTTNGSNPTVSSGTVYSAPIAISSTTTIKAIAYTTGGTPSSVASGIYTISATPGTTAIAANGNVTLGTDHVSYGSTQDGQDGKPSSIVISQDGTTATLSGNAWKTLPLSYLVTANTMLDVTLESGNVGEILGLALDNDLQPTVGKRAFLFAGSEVDGTAHSSWAWTIMPTPAYAVNSGPQTFQSCCW